MGQSASTGQGSIGADELKVTGDGSANQFLAGDGDGTFTFKDGTLSTTTTTGDIIYRANSSALARLGIGSTGQVLTVANGVPAWSTDTEAYLPSAGGTMSGNIAMGGGNISGGGTITGTFVGGITGNVTGNADTATALATARAINGVDFDGSAAITVTAAAGTLSGTELKSTVVTSSLESVGTLSTLTVDNVIVNDATIGHTSDTDLMTLADGALTLAGTLAVGASGSGSNVTFYSGSSDSVGMVWDEDGGTGTTNGALHLGADDHGVDFKVFGDTASKYMEWDSSADTLTVAGTIATADLVLNNDRGHYLIVEEEDYLSIKNEKTGKLYKFVLEEIDGN
jgi:hypothetical protein